MTPIICDADDHTAIVSFPTRLVRRVCAYCGCELGEYEKVEGYEPEESHGACEPCSLLALPHNLRPLLLDAFDAGGMEYVHDEPLRKGERVFERRNKP